MKQNRSKETILSLNDRNIFFAVLMAVLGVCAAANAQTTSAVTDKPKAVSAPASGSVSQEADEDDQSADDEDEGFEPNWSGEVGYTFSLQPVQQGSGQIANEVTATATYNFTESGHYMMFVAGGGQQILEGTSTSYGTFSAGGGLGFGFFQPALTVAFEQGAQALNSLDGNLTLTFQMVKPLSLGLIAEASPQSHQAPLNQVLGTSSDQIDEIDSLDLTGGAVLTFTPWDVLDLSVTGEKDYSRTYQWQNILHTAVHLLKQTLQIPSVTFATNLTFIPSLTLTLSAQVGQEDFPAGVVYSPILKQTVKNATATTEGFTAYSLGLTYNL